jgi:hypothetical protein
MKPDWESERHQQYVAKIEAMADAAESWRQQHPDCRRLAMNFPPKEVMVAADLGSLIDRVAPEDENARDLLRTMNAAADGQGTLFMAQIVLKMLGGHD